MLTWRVIITRIVHVERFVEQLRHMVHSLLVKCNQVIFMHGGRGWKVAIPHEADYTLL